MRPILSIVANVSGQTYAVFLMKHVLIACSFLWCSWAWAEPGLTHSSAQATETIRQHHLQRLYNRFHQDPAVLRQTCRYESEIATAPPLRKVVLSFDDGPEPGQTKQILDLLKKHEIQGTFFLIGEKARAHPDLVEQILAEGGHTVGNHSWSHPNFHDIPAAKQAQEVLKYEEGAHKGRSRGFSATHMATLPVRPMVFCTSGATALWAGMWTPAIGLLTRPGMSV